MERRTQRHMKSEEQNPMRTTRMGKNKFLYDEINMKIGYEEIVNLDTQTRIDLSELANKTTTNRENYQKLKDYHKLVEIEELEKKEEPELKQKSYDINNILEEAKKNRVKYDELEKKRKLRENDYATLADISKKEEYLGKKSDKDIDEEELTTLINTITSHNLRNEIDEAAKKTTIGDEEILSELLATNVDLKLEEGIADEFTKPTKVSEIDDSFYTKSMDLSEQDFEFSEELENDKKTKIKIISVILVIAIIIAIVVYFIIKQKGII